MKSVPCYICYLSYYTYICCFFGVVSVHNNVGMSDPFASRASALFHARRLEKEIIAQKQKVTKLVHGIAAAEVEAEAKKKEKPPPELGLHLEPEKVLPRWQGMSRIISRERTSSSDSHGSRPSSSSKGSMSTKAGCSMKLNGNGNVNAKDVLSRSSSPTRSLCSPRISEPNYSDSVLPSPMGRNGTKMSVKLELSAGLISSVEVETEHEKRDSLKPRMVSNHVLMNPSVIPRRVPHGIQTTITPSTMSQSTPNLATIGSARSNTSQKTSVTINGSVGLDKSTARTPISTGFIDYSQDIKEAVQELHDEKTKRHDRSRQNTGIDAALGQMGQHSKSQQHLHTATTHSSIPKAVGHAKAKTGTCGGDLYAARVMRSIAHIHDDPFAYKPPGPVAPDLGSLEPYFKPMGSKVTERLRQVRSWRNHEGHSIPMPTELLKASHSTRQVGGDIILGDEPLVEEEVGISPMKKASLNPTDYKHLFDETNSRLAKVVVTRTRVRDDDEELDEDGVFEDRNINSPSIQTNPSPNPLEPNKINSNVSLSVKMKKESSFSPLNPSVSFRLNSSREGTGIDGNWGNSKFVPLAATDKWDGFAEYVDEEVDGGGTTDVSGVRPGQSFGDAPLVDPMSQSHLAPNASRSMVDNKNAQVLSLMTAVCCLCVVRYSDCLCI